MTFVEDEIWHRALEGEDVFTLAESIAKLMLPNERRDLEHACQRIEAALTLIVERDRLKKDLTSRRT